MVNRCAKFEFMNVTKTPNILHFKIFVNIA